jgi:hypothetical protein
VNFHVYDAKKIPAFLTAYFGRPPTPEELAKFYVLRPFCYAFHALRLAYLANLHSQPSELNPLEHDAFQLAIRRQEFDLSLPEIQYALAVSFMNKTLTRLQEKEFQEGYATLIALRSSHD